MRRLGLAAIVAVALLPASDFAGNDVAPFWRLRPSDIARYDKCRVTVKAGKESVGEASIWTVHGHCLRDSGLYLPVTPTCGDLPALFALRTPASGPVEWSFRLEETQEVRVKGTATSSSKSLDTLDLHVEAKFESVGRPTESDTYVLRDGAAKATIDFDVAAGVVRSSRVAVSYVREKADPKKNDKPSRVDETWTFALKGVSALGYADFPSDVNAAIDRGVAYVKKLQKPEGKFEYPGHDQGATALCVYTLVSCGVPVGDPGVEKGLAFLCGSDATRTYEQALGLMAVERAYTPPDELSLRRAPDGRKPVRDVPPARRAWCEKTAAALESGCNAPGVWGYPNAGNDLYRFDTSNTQYAVLGLQAASRLGIAVKESTWLGAVRHFEQVRDGDGPRGSVALMRAGHAVTETVYSSAVARVAGFRYRPGERRAWGSMTCAGIASLSIVRDELRRGKSAKLASKEEEIDEMILGGWAWLDHHWGVDRHPEKTGDPWYYYWLYALERAAVLDQVQRVNGRDWYFEGATELLARQKKDGDWEEPGDNHVSETCFALLFLKRATAPLTPK